MKKDLEQALALMPQHRAQFKKSRTQTLDDLLDDHRQTHALSNSSFDFVMMGYRYHHLFQAELKSFLRKPLKPREVEDLLQVCFAALLSRRSEQESGLVFWTVELAKELYGSAVASLVNAFCRNIQRKKNFIQDQAAKDPQGILGPELSRRWGAYPHLLQRVAQKVLLRPESGIEGFAENLEWKRHPTEILALPKFQAMNRASWDFIQRSLEILKENFPQKMGLRMLDACAAPGAKLTSFALLSRSMGYSIELFATEAKYPRLERLRENLKRWNLDQDTHTELFSWGTDQTWSNGGFDIILADLPCTGSGTLRERPDLLTRDFGRDVKELTKLQTGILNQLRPLLNRPGILFVSLCSVDPSEVDQISETLGSKPFYDTRSQENWDFEDLVGWFFIQK